MRPTDLEALIPGRKEAREAEHLHRSLCFAGISWTVAGFELVPFTPRHKLELTLTKNPFVCVEGLPNAAHLYQFLWRLHPKFSRSSFTLPVLLAKASIKRNIKAMTPDGVLNASLAICDYLDAMMQDLPEVEWGSVGSMPVNHVHWMATEAGFFMLHFHGFTLQSYMDTPYLILQQLFRTYKSTVEENPNFINKSDQIVGQWQRQQLKSPKS